MHKQQPLPSYGGRGYHLCVRLLRCSGGVLTAGVVDGVLPGVDQLGDGDDGEAVLDQLFQDPGQSLRGMEGGVVEQDDAARLHLGGDAAVNGVGVVVLPVQTVRVPNKGKSLWHKGYDI